MVLCILIFICEFLYTCIFFSYQSECVKCVKVFTSDEEISAVASLQQYKDKQGNEVF